MSIKLEINDNNGNIIEEDNLEICDGDILIVQFDEHMKSFKIEEAIKSIRNAFEEKRKRPDTIAGIVIPDTVTLKVLKVTKE